MQVFIPYPDIKRSVQSLDYRRLGKQRVECLQINNALEYRKTNNLFKENGKKRGWLNHKCTLMWVGKEQFLRLYAIACCEEWKARGYTDNLMPRFKAQFAASTQFPFVPEWWGNAAIHKSHRSMLVQKLPEHYSQVFTDYDSDNPEYVWVVPNGVHYV